MLIDQSIGDEALLGNPRAHPPCTEKPGTVTF